MHQYSNYYAYFRQLAYVECKIKFSVPGFVQKVIFCQFGRILDHFGHF